MRQRIGSGPSAVSDVSRAKSRFIAPFLALQILTLVVAAIAVLVGAADGRICWLPPMLIASSFLGFMAWLMYSGRARTRARLPALWITAAVAALLAIGCVLVEGRDALLPLLLTLAGVAGTVLYESWYSRLGRRAAGPLRVGERLPDFTLLELSGRSIRSSTIAGRPAVLLFYRGNWCPLCSAQVRELTEQYRALDALGARVFLISPQPRIESMELAARFDVSFEFLVDEGAQVARQLSILHERGVPVGVRGYGADTVYPTVVITDARGTIVYTDQTDNYRVRPEPSVFLEVLSPSIPSGSAATVSRPT